MMFIKLIVYYAFAKSKKKRILKNKVFSPQKFHKKKNKKNYQSETEIKLKFPKEELNVKIN